MSRWWARFTAYGILLVATAWLSYQLAFHHYAGPHPDDGDAEPGFFLGLAWACGVSVILMLGLALIEVLLTLRSPPSAAPREVMRTVEQPS